MRLLRFIILLLVFPIAIAAMAEDGKSEDEKPAIELEEIEVVAKVPDIVQRGDTMVINAAAFKVPEGSMLEELVKRIPGLEFDQRNYTMTYNGRPITEINVNGEVFFSGDTKLALTNLPVEIIEKIKVYNKQSDESKYTGLKDRNDNLVLDVNTKKSFDGVVSGEIEAAVGTEHRKGADGNAHCFKTNGDALSANFSTGNIGLNSSNRRNLNQSAGVQFNKKFDNGLRINASVSGDRNRGGDESAEYSEQYLPSENRYQNYISGSGYDSKSLSGHLGLRWEIDSMTYVSLNSSLGNTRAENENSSQQAVFSDNPGLDLRNPFSDDTHVDPSIRINRLQNRSESNSRSNHYSFNVRAVRRLGSKGANISAGFGVSGNKRRAVSYSMSRTDFYRLKSYLGDDSILYRNQYRETPGHGSSYSATFNFTYPILKDLIASVGYSFSYARTKSSRSTYGLPMPASPEAPLFMLPEDYQTFMVDSLSDDNHSGGVAQDISLVLQYDRKPLRIIATISARPQSNNLDQLSGVNAIDTVIRRVLLRPMIYGEWNKNGLRIDFNYDGDTRAPSVTDLISVADNSNPLYITKANPNLKCSYSQSFRLNAMHNRSGVSASFGFTNEWNTIVRAVTYNPETGGRVTEPRNINGNYSFSGSLRYYKRFGKFSVSASTSGGINHNVSFVTEGSSPEPQESKTVIKNVSVGTQLSYTPSWGGFYLNGAWMGNYSNNSFNDTFTRTEVISCGLSAFARLPFGFRMETGIGCSFRGGNYTYAGQRNTVKWNAGISRVFFKKNQLEIGLKWDDILNQKVSSTIHSTATSFMESYIDQIGGYILLTAKFRFSTTKDN